MKTIRSMLNVSIRQLAWFVLNIVMWAGTSASPKLYILVTVQWTVSDCRRLTRIWTLDNKLQKGVVHTNLNKIGVSWSSCPVCTMRLVTLILNPMEIPTPQNKCHHDVLFCFVFVVVFLWWCCAIMGMWSEQMCGCLTREREVTSALWEIVSEE